MMSQIEYREVRRRISVLEDLLEGLRSEHGANPQYFEALALPYRDELIRLRRELDDYLGVNELPSADLVLRIEGEGVQAGTAPGSLLADRLVALRKSVVAVAESLSTGQAREIGRPVDEIAQMADFRVVGLAAGSLKVAVDFPAAVRQTRLDESEPEKTARWYVKKAVEMIVEGGEWIETDGQKVPKDLEESPALETLMIRLRQLAPSPRGKVTRFVLEGRDICPGRTVELTSESRAKSLTVLRERERAEPYDDRGVLKALRYDKDRDVRDIVLRERIGGPEELECEFDESLKADVFRAVLRQAEVQLRGVLTTKPGPPRQVTFFVEELEFL